MHHPSVVRHEVVRWVFGSDPTLQRESVSRDCVLAAKTDSVVIQW